MGSADTLDAFLSSARRRIDDALERHLPRPPSCPAVISEAMRYSLFAGGKRLRAVLALAAADAVARAAAASNGGHPGGVSPSADDAIDLAIPAACAVEFIHTYSLIHDDLPAMDDDTMRRGRATLHVVYGDGIAILAADGLHSEAFALVARAPATDDPAIVSRKLRVVQLIAEAAGATGMVGGQAIDLQAAGQGPAGTLRLDAAGLQGMHAMKTGALIRASTTSGALMAGADEALRRDTDRFAADLGLAFQIVDDILDVEGEAVELGKTAGKDAADSKATYPALYGLDRSRTLARECIERARQRLVDAGLNQGHLGAIAEWVLSRRN